MAGKHKRLTLIERISLLLLVVIALTAGLYTVFRSSGHAVDESGTASHDSAIVRIISGHPQQKIDVSQKPQKSKSQSNDTTTSAERRSKGKSQTSTGVHTPPVGRNYVGDSIAQSPYSSR